MGSTARRRRQKRPECTEWHQPSTDSQRWRSTSPTVRYIRENANRLRGSFSAVRKGLDTARYSALSSGKDAKFRILNYLKAIQSIDRRRPEASAENHGREENEDLTDLQKVLRKLVRKRDSQSFAIGVMSFGALLFLSGSQPWALPWIYVAFAGISLPLRVLDFIRRKWIFFLFDFCYFANFVVFCFFLLGTKDARLLQAAYALADGPLAAALIVWQTAWVFGSSAHTISVLIHQLPGLALFAFKYYQPPPALERFLPSSRALVKNLPGYSLRWSFFAPLTFYLVWQLAYFLIVQVISRKFIKANGYDTSYSCLARRAVKTNNFWNRTVRKGSSLRRVMMFGLIQAVYTICVLACLAPISVSFWLSFIWQVVKIAYPVWHGARHICEKVPRRAVMEVWKQHQVVQ